MAGKDRVLTLPECMTEALTAAVEQGAGCELTDARFGRFAAVGAGWYWELEFRREAASHPRLGLRGGDDPIARRFKMIVAAYEQERAKMMEAPR
jgi:hypothetical protein